MHGCTLLSYCYIQNCTLKIQPFFEFQALFIKLVLLISYQFRHASGDHDRATLIAQLINKHQEQKEAFLKACTLARRTAETFLKYSNRSLQYFTHPNESTFRGPETKVKSKYLYQKSKT